MPDKIVIEPFTGRALTSDETETESAALGRREESLAEEFRRGDAASRARQFEGDEGVALALGGLQGATAGLFAPALKAFGADSTILKGLVDEHRGYYVGGNVAGALVTSLGALSNVAGLKTIAGALPTGLLSRGSSALGKAAGGGLLGSAVEGAVEGGLFNLGSTVGEYSIQDKPLTSEAVAGALLYGTGAGALAGGVAHQVLKSANKIRFAKLFSESPIGDDLLDGMRQQFDEADAVLRGRKTPLDDLDTDINLGESQHAGNVAEGDVLGAVRRARVGVDGPGPQGTQVLDAAEQTVKGGGPVRLDQGISDPGVKSALKANRALRAETDELHKLQKELRSALGATKSDETVDFLRKLEDLAPPDAFRAIKAYDDYINGARKLAKSRGYQHSLDDIGGALVEKVKGMKEAAGIPNSAKAMDILAASIGAAEITEITTGVDVIPGGPVVEALATLWAMSRHAKGGLKLGKLFGDTSRSAAGLAGQRVLQQVLGKKGGLKGAAAGAVGAVFGRKAATKAFDNVTSNIAAIQMGSMERIHRAAKAVLNVGAKAIKSQGAKQSSFKLFKHFLWDVPEGKNEAEKFASKMTELHRLASDPNGALKRIQESLVDVQLVSPEVAKLSAIKMLEAITFLSRVAPRDPGTVSVFGQSQWIPNKAEMSAFKKYMVGALDPAGVFEMVASGRLSPEAVEALKAVNPEHYQRFQTMIAENPKQVAKLPYSVQNSLGVLFESSTNPMLASTANLQENHGVSQDEKQAQQDQVQGAPQGQSPNQLEPTTAQQLTTKEF